jgi:hypothetical protein
MALVHSTAALTTRGARLEHTLLVPYGVAIAAGSAAYAVSTVVPSLRLPV